MTSIADSFQVFIAAAAADFVSCQLML